MTFQNIIKFRHNIVLYQCAVKRHCLHHRAFFFCFTKIKASIEHNVHFFVSDLSTVTDATSVVLFFVKHEF